MLDSSPPVGFLEHFEDLPDPRQSWKILYPLGEILLLALLAVISGADTWQDIALYGECQLDFLRGFSPFKNGTPSQDTLGELSPN